MSGANKKLSVIVLFYHGERWIEPCIQSLQDQSLARDEYELILVDNGGSTPSVSNFNGHPHIKTLHFPENFGFAGGNNRAVTVAAGEFIVLMNQDAITHYQCLEELIDAFEVNPQAGLISANMKMVSTQDTVDPHSQLDNSVGHYRLSPMGYASYLTEDTHERLLPVNFVSGNALCFHKALLEKIGNYLFDDRLGSYAEDLDLSLRLMKQNRPMYVCSRAIVYHFRDDAFSGKPRDLLRKLLHISSNRLLVYYNNLKLGDFLLKLPALLIGVSSKVIRQDGKPQIHLLHFMVAMGCIPFVFTHFVIKALNSPNIKIQKNRPRKAN